MLFDPIRCLWVAPTPEEKVRQTWIQRMIVELGYPKSLLTVEKDLASLSHRRLSKEADPHRRFDLICFTPKNDGLIPLLLIECKAGAIGLAAEKQALGYNDVLGAPFICLVNANSAKTLWHEKGKLRWVLFLPPYDQLVEKL